MTLTLPLGYKVSAKPLGFIFSHTFQIIRIKFSMVLIYWPCSKKPLPLACIQTFMNQFIQILLDDTDSSDWTLHFQTSLLHGLMKETVTYAWVGDCRNFTEFPQNQTFKIKISFLFFFFFLLYFNMYTMCNSTTFALRHTQISFYGTYDRQAAIFFCTCMIQTWSSFSLVDPWYFFVFQ